MLWEKREFKVFCKELKKINKCRPYNKHKGMDCYTLKPNNRINKPVRYNPSISVLRKDYGFSDIIAIDTETYKGVCKLIANSDGKYILEPTFEQCIEFLFKKYTCKGIRRFFYNIEFDITSILKLCKNKELIDAISSENTVLWKNYKIFWIRKKLFKIYDIKRKRSVHFTDLFTFFGISLDSAVKQHLKGQRKGKIDGKKLNTSLKYWNANLPKVIDYCILDCNITKQLGFRLLNTMKQLNLPIPRTLVSPASISKCYFRKDNYIGSLKDVPIKVIQAFYDAYYGGRFDVFEIGSFKELFLYDINSQYPNMIRNLPILQKDRFKLVKNIDSIPKNETIAVYYAKLNIPDGKLSTIPFRNTNNTIIFPTGKIQNWFTWYDLDLMRDYIESIKFGYVYERKEREIYPFMQLMYKLYKQKTYFKKNKDKFKMEYLLTKVVMNALYGCFIEIHKNKQDILKAGIMFNPIYASIITGYGRWSVIKNIPDKKLKFIKAIHTDSLISSQSLNELELSNEIGKWSLETKGKGLIVGTGQYQIGNIVKRRGIPKKFINNWSELLQKNRDKRCIRLPIERMLKLRESIFRGISMNEVNTMVNSIRKLRIDAVESKRVFGMELEAIPFGYLLKNTVKSIPYTIINNKVDLNVDLYTSISKLTKGGW